MQVGIHRLAFVRILGAQPHVGDLRPVAAQSLPIAAEASVVRILLDGLEEVLRTLQGALVARSAAVFAHAVDGKALAVDLFLRIERVPCGIDRPVDSAVSGIHEAALDILLGPTGHLQAGGITRYAVRRRKGPQQAHVEHRSPRSVAMQLPVSGNPAVEAAPVGIGRSHPERQDVPRQFLSHLIGHAADGIFLFPVHIGLFCGRRTGGLQFSLIVFQRSCRSGISSRVRTRSSFRIVRKSASVLSLPPLV